MDNKIKNYLNCVPPPPPKNYECPPELLPFFEIHYPKQVCPIYHSFIILDSRSYYYFSIVCFIILLLFFQFTSEYLCNPNRLLSPRALPCPLPYPLKMKVPRSSLHPPRPLYLRPLMMSSLATPPLSDSSHPYRRSNAVCLLSISSPSPSIPCLLPSSYSAVTSAYPSPSAPSSPPPPFTLPLLIFLSFHFSSFSRKTEVVREIEGFPCTNRNQPHPNSG